MTAETPSIHGPAGSASLGWRLERRLEVRKLDELAALLVATAIGLALCSALIAAAGKGVIASYAALADGAFGSKKALYETLVQATPLILTGLAVAFAFRAQVWNIGAEGQFFAGTMGSFFVIDLAGDSAPRAAMIALILVAAAAGGALWGAVAGVLKARFGTNEIITTVMLNFIILFILSYLLGGPWRADDTFYFQTERFPESAQFPRLVDGARLHLGFVVAVAAALAVGVLLNRTALGYEVRGIGVNPRAGAYKGISAARTTVLVMLISGAIAGLAGAGEVAGVHHRLQLGISNNVGFVGIIIALVGRLHPAGVVVAAIGFGALVNGATTMQIETGVPAALVDVVQGVSLVLVLVATVAVRYRLTRRSPAGG